MSIELTEEERKRYMAALKCAEDWFSEDLQHQCREKHMSGVLELARRVLAASEPEAEERPTMDQTRAAVIEAAEDETYADAIHRLRTADKILAAVGEFMRDLSDEDDEARGDEPEIKAADGLRKALSKLVRP